MQHQTLSFMLSDSVIGIYCSRHISLENSLKQKRALVLCINHRYLKKVDCSSFVMCPLLTLPFQRAYLRQPLTVLTRQISQGVRAINQSIFLRCLWHKQSRRAGAGRWVDKAGQAGSIDCHNHQYLFSSH
jgi:hypothetical protein